VEGVPLFDPQRFAMRLVVFALTTIALAPGVAREAHAGTYNLAASWPAVGTKELVSDGTTLYALDPTTGVVTHFDASGAAIGSFTVTADPLRPAMTLAGFDVSGNLYVAHPADGGPYYGSTVDLYSSVGAVIDPPRSSPWPIDAVDHEGFMWATVRDEYNEKDFFKISPQGDSLGVLDGLGRYGRVYGVSWDDHLFANRTASGGCPTSTCGWFGSAGGSGGSVRGEDCGNASIYLPGWATTDGQNGAFISALRTEAYQYHYSIDRYGPGAGHLLARFETTTQADMVASDSQGAVYLLYRDPGKIEKWVPSTETPTVASSWGALKVRWR